MSEEEWRVVKIGDLVVYSTREGVSVGRVAVKTRYGADINRGSEYYMTSRFIYLRYENIHLTNHGSPGV